MSVTLHEQQKWEPMNNLRECMLQVLLFFNAINNVLHCHLLAHRFFLG